MASKSDFHQTLPSELSEPISNLDSSTNNNAPEKSQYPRIPIDLRAHKLAIAIPWIVLVTTGCILPIVGYFSLHYATTVNLHVVLSPWMALFGVSSLFSMFKRIWDLGRKESTCRPLGVTSKWALDFFTWNFIIVFIIVTVVISVGIAIENVRMASLPLSIIIGWIAIEMVLVRILSALGVKTPCRVSSVGRGQSMPPAVYIITEDVVAVDGKQGTEFRKIWADRYEASPVIRSLLAKLDWMWGVSGIMLVAAIVAIISAVDEESVGFAVGKFPVSTRSPPSEETDV
ncbi:hypothetical protein K402DRAFT_398790, partial [Aulographum hederae CBS 113979]